MYHNIDKKVKEQWKTINKLGVGGGFREAWGERNMWNITTITPKSIKKLQTHEQTAPESVVSRRTSVFEFNNAL